MRIVLFAWCPSTAYVEALRAHGAEPALIVTGPGSRGESALIARSAEGALPLERCEDVNEPGFVARVASLGPDLLMITGCPQVLRAPLLATPRLGAVNFHPSLLPHYRGKEPLFWALLRGEAQVGVTVHRVTEDIDGGPILFQRAVDVPPRATSASLALDVDRAGAELVPELLEAAGAGALPAGHRTLERGSAFPPLRPEHGLLDWTRSADELDRHVRACAGEIHAYSFHGGMKVILLEARPVPATRVEIPGTVLAIDHGAMVIATSNGALAGSRWLFLHRAHRGDRLAALLGIEPGARLTSNPAF